MSSNGAANVVVDLATARQRRQRTARTIILRASNIRADEEVHRHIGVNDSLHLADLHEILVTTFGLGEDTGATPWHFSQAGDRDERIDAADAIHTHLRSEGDTLAYHWGLWVIDISAIESYPRDAGTPRALCVGGSGSFGGQGFDLADINAQLTGTTTIREVLAATNSEVRGLIDRSGIFDFVPLLQALALTRPGSLPADVSAVLDQLPVETDPMERDAFWAIVLALACMGDEAMSNHVLEATMGGLGWPLDGPATRAACVESLRVLSDVGAYGTDALSPVDRLDFYRELLRA